MNFHPNSHATLNRRRNDRGSRKLLKPPALAVTDCLLCVYCLDTAPSHGSAQLARPPPGHHPANDRGLPGGQKVGSCRRFGLHFRPLRLLSFLSFPSPANLSGSGATGPSRPQPGADRRRGHVQAVGVGRAQPSPAGADPALPPVDKGSRHRTGAGFTVRGQSRKCHKLTFSSNHSERRDVDTFRPDVR